MSGKWYTGLTTKRDALQSEKFGFGIPAAAEDGRGRFYIRPACGAGNTGGYGIGPYNLCIFKAATGRRATKIPNPELLIFL